MGGLYINGVDAFAQWGVRMGDKFLDSLGAPCPLKTPIENESRADNGKQILGYPVLASRQLNLEFTITGESPDNFASKKADFFATLYQGWVTIHVPDNGWETYNLWYLGTSPTYSQSRNRCFCKVMVKFEEPNPVNR